MTDTITAYKAVRRDGLDRHSGTVDYRDAVGHDIVIYDEAGPAKLCSSSVLHACRNPLAVFRWAPLDSAIFEVTGIPVVEDDTKCGFERLHIVGEIARGPDLDALLGFSHAEACDPVIPWLVTPVALSAHHLELLAVWASVWPSVWASVRDSVWPSVRASVWPSVRDSVWASVWDSVIRGSVWNSVWVSVRNSVVRASVWNSIWAYTGSLLPGICPDDAGSYKFQSVVDLWRDGLVPSYDGTTWRLHSAPDGRVVWEGAL